YKDVLKGVFESEEKVKARKDTILALYFYNYNMGVVSSFFKKLKRHAENRYEISLVYMLDTFYHLDMYNEEKAKESLRKIISVDSQNADALHLLYLLEYDGENEKEEFFEKLKNALSINKENPYILNSCASICVQLKKYDEGIEYANRAIKVDGSLCQPYSILSLAYAGLKNDTESEKYKNQAVSKGADGEIIDLYINDINEGVELCCAYDDSEDVFVYNNYKMK
ncbi:MAG: hypothetical protein IKA02_04060, partial [Clostridia bacterium]|nr:hypothetical protein [Clostridia bacterium]